MFRKRDIQEGNIYKSKFPNKEEYKVISIDNEALNFMINGDTKTIYTTTMMNFLKNIKRR